MSAKDGILHAMKWTVKDEFNHKMEVSNAVDGCVIFYPHNQAVQITYEDLEKLIENLKKPNSDYIRKNTKNDEIPENIEKTLNKSLVQKKFLGFINGNYSNDVDFEFTNGADSYIHEELGKRLAVPEKPVEYSAHELEVACQEFADNYHGTYDPETKTIRVPIDEIIDDCANRLEQFNISFRYISKDLKDYVYIIQL